MGLVDMDAPPAIALRALTILLGMMVGGGLLVMVIRAFRKRGPEAESKPKVPLGTRYLTLMALVVLVIGPAFAGGWLFVAAIAAVAALGLAELWGALDAAGTPPLRPAGYLTGVALPLSAALGGAGALGPALGVGFAIIALWALRSGTDRLLGRLGGTVLGVVYVGLLAAFMVLLRRGPGGFGRYLFFLVVIQMADLGGLFGGMAFGKRRLAPALSPGKTWEGTMASLLAAALGGGLFAFAMPELPPHLPPLLAVPLALTGLLGDLLASGMKRAVGLKDFGGALPGHGGILDRFDSYLVSAPIAWALFAIVDRM